MTSIDLSRAGHLGELIAAEPSAPIAVLDGVETVAFVLAAQELAAMYATQSLLATNGAMAAIAEGLADLAAGRSQRWSELRIEHGRGSEDEPPAVEGIDAVLSHRARWDVELLEPSVAQACFDALDTVAELTRGHRLTAGFPSLRLVVASGYRMVVKPSADEFAVVHVDTAPESATIESNSIAAPG